MSTDSLGTKSQTCPCCEPFPAECRGGMAHRGRATRAGVYTSRFHRCIMCAPHSRLLLVTVANLWWLLLLQRQDPYSLGCWMQPTTAYLGRCTESMQDDINSFSWPPPVTVSHAGCYWWIFINKWVTDSKQPVDSVYCSSKCYRLSHTCS